MARPKSKSKQIIAPQASKGLKVTDLGDPPPAPADDKSYAHTRALQRQEDRQRFVSIAERIARDTLHFRHYKWPGADREFPESVDAAMRFVSKYFPHAQGGALYVDEPRTAREARRCEEKGKLLRKQGLRYVVINDAYQEGSESIPAATLESCMEQLGAA